MKLDDTDEFEHDELNYESRIVCSKHKIELKALYCPKCMLKKRLKNKAYLAALTEEEKKKLGIKET